MKLIALVTAFLLVPLALLSSENDKKKTKKPETQTQTQPQTEPTVTYEVIKEGTSSGVREAMAKVITTRKDWEDLWKKHASMIVPQPPVPDIDFDTNMVAVIFTGEKPTSGFRVLLKDVSFKGSDVVVTYRQIEPPANSYILQVITQPFLMVKVQKPPAGTVQLVKQ